ncbi:MAG: molybdopterin-guanine dinucleotide biosynthesis protein B [Deltaproteobacteria bacterium]|nr:molybdopterin-guanine dinucleotide biosynthesis protein B [Deltaproteobacteria bacterium]
MIPIVSIVGRSGSGKTTLLEQVIRHLTERGYRVGTIKHDAHDFEIDYEGKDSWRHKRAGAKTVVLASSKKVAVVKEVETEWSPESLAFTFASDHDIVITEGFKQSTIPKIEVFRRSHTEEPVCLEDPNLIALATEIEAEQARGKEKGNLPRLDINNSEGVANFIERRFLTPIPERGVLLSVDGKVVTLKPFIDRLIKESVRGIIKSLKGYSNPGEIELKIRK